MIFNIILHKKEGLYQLSSSDQISYYDLAKYFAVVKGYDHNLIKAKNAKNKDIGFEFIPKYSNLEMFKEKKLFNFIQPSSEKSLQSLFR
jgi:hypothetical protein